MFERGIWWEISFIFLILFAWDVPSKVSVRAELEDEIGKWAQVFGDELWQMSQSVTRLSEIKSNYKGKNAQVLRKDGKQLLDDIVDNVETMMKYKMDAIKCIMTTVEREAADFDETDRVANYTYYSSKFSEIEGEEFDPKVIRNNKAYDPMVLSPDSRYFNIPVNLSHSAVHVPTNLNDRAPAVLGAIQWSEELDEVFLSNYKSDPALTWQFFGSSSGFLRNFPAMEWNQQPDQYDCRMRSWYIEAATCTKDVVILMDTTGSMRGMRMRIAKLTVNNILDTLTSNDFVNVFNFSETHQPMVPCFDDSMLVQATPENVNTFKENVNLMGPEGHANFSIVFSMAFELLAKYREMRGCNDTSGVQCNQEIMLVTDGLPYNITEVFEEYNWFNNGTDIPVRIFSFLIGREVFKVKEIQLIACLNRGFYKHIHSLDEVREGVFTYVPVLARPLVLQGDVHPVTWSTVYSDTTDSKYNEWLFDVMEHSEQKDRLYKYNRNKKLYFSQREADRKYIKELKKEQEELKGTIRQREYHLQVTVSIPVYDRKPTTTNYTNMADLLGVAGTDILLDHVKYLTRPYKIGVNGYAFIINNNGIVILHPDLRPVSNYELKKNLNSVDLTEIEQLDDDSEYREPSPEIMELREAMINRSEGQMLNLRSKYHYDDMHRVVIEDRDIFYAPLKGTPFSIGLSLPHPYGFFQSKARSQEVMYTLWEGKLLDYFKGYDWKIRPDWTYCKYHHQNLHPFDSAERELRHFLEKMELEDRNFKWEPQYDTDYLEAWKYNLDDDTGETEFLNCNRKPIPDDSYYCEKDLVQLLIYDAKVTRHTFGTSKDWAYKDDEERDLLEMYNSTLRFISTQSGLTRWQYMLDSDEQEYRRTEFGNLHKRAIDESWYISAVLQHHIDPQSFVYSLSFDGLGITEDDAFITASYAIFPRENNTEAPASVLGLQFRQSALAARFFSVTANEKCPECREQCASEELDCFVIDNNGYVVVSENQNDTGRFFGEIDGAVMDAMVSKSIFRRTTIYDYHSLCFEQILKKKDAACSLFTPFQHIHWFIQWLVGEMTWLVVQTNLQDLWGHAHAYKSYDDDDDEYNDYYHSVEVKDEDDVLASNETDTVEEDEDEYETIHHTCDQKADMYELDQNYLKQLHKEGFRTALQNCSRPFYVRSIAHSNLVLLVVDAMHGSCFRHFSAHLTEIYGNETHFACKKIYLNSFPRRKLSGCFTQHQEEEYIRECGDRSSHLNLSLVSLLICLFIGLVNFTFNQQD